MAACVRRSTQDEQPVSTFAVERKWKLAKGRLAATASGVGTVMSVARNAAACGAGPEAHAAFKTGLAGWRVHLRSRSGVLKRGSRIHCLMNVDIADCTTRRHGHLQAQHPVVAIRLGYHSAQRALTRTRS